MVNLKIGKLKSSVLILLLVLALTPILSNTNSLVNTNNIDGELPVVNSYDNLRKILKNSQINYGNAETTEAVANQSEAMKSTSTDAGTDYSTTNIQVNGVDEADIVKTDGKYIYQISNNSINIIDAYPVENMKLYKNINLSFSPMEIYVDDKYLTVIGSSYYEGNYTQADNNNKESEPYYYHSNTVRIEIYNIEDVHNIQKERELELEGNYVSSRKVGSSLYLVTNKYIDVYYILNENKEIPTPFYSDSSTGEDKINVGYDEIKYFPNSVESNYLMVAGINLDEPEQGINVETYLGAGQSIYASPEHLYVSVTTYENTNSKLNGLSTEQPAQIKQSSSIYKFKMKNGNIEYLDNNEVPGVILNQFSMDEYNGYFRITTTTGEVWNNNSNNNIYVLDESLEEVGKLENIAPGERIYSVRFMGNRAYMVTFKKVDPLYVIDLQNPSAPTILGELKIPGYSDYLHPYDENHLIGFGKEAVEAKDGSIGDGSWAYYQGMKIAVFDVSDVNNPKEKFVETIGDRGTDSELLYNHKALLFSKESGLLAFPVTVMEMKEPSNDVTQYGQFQFQGAYVYHLDMETGFTLKSKITHLTEEEYQNSRDYWYDYNSNINRILYIDDTLYTLSNDEIKAHSLTDYHEINQLELPIN